MKKKKIKVNKKAILFILHNCYHIKIENFKVLILTFDDNMLMLHIRAKINEKNAIQPTLTIV